MKSKATVGGGCFWCVEAAFKEVQGITDITVGYAGGETEDPTYESVCTGTTGHAEVVQVTFEPATISYETILEVFFTIHDPTQRNRQGPDVGSQYRSIILYHDDEQRELATAIVNELDDTLDRSVVTEITELVEFFPAEPYHQDYFAKNPADAYCRMHAVPKVEKVRETFEGLATPETEH